MSVYADPTWQGLVVDALRRAATWAEADDMVAEYQAASDWWASLPWPGPYSMTVLIRAPASFRLAELRRRSRW